MGRARVGMALAVLALGVAAFPRGVSAQSELLRRELEAMREQLRQMQEQLKKQQELIDKLSTERAPGAPPPAAARAAEPKSAADEERLRREITEHIMRRLQPQLAAANKTFPSQFNPAIGLIIDTVASYGSKTRGDFQFRAAELGVSASVDPFARGYAIITGSADAFDVEEAAIVTTSLPYNLTVKGGRFFADFGRLSKFHDHDLPFVNRPVVLDTYVGGESQSDGVEVNYLVPMKQYLTLTGGWYNKMGAGNDRVNNTVARDLSQFTYLGRAATFLNLTDSNSVDLGGSWAYTPEVKMDNGAMRNLVGVDLTYRYSPLAQASYRGLVWGTELLYNQEDRPVGGFPTTAAAVAATSLERGLGVPTPGAETRGSPFALSDAPVVAPKPLIFKRRDATGLYSYLEARLSQRYYPGFLLDYAQDIDHVVGPTFAYSPYLTVWLSEFQRLRFQYTRLEQPGLHENEFFLQWTVILGSHVHSFRDR